MIDQTEQHVVIAAGPIISTVKDWLVEHGATITAIVFFTHTKTIFLIALPPQTIIRREGDYYRYTLCFPGETSTVEVVQDDIDAYKTTLTLHQDGGTE